MKTIILRKGNIKLRKPRDLDKFRIAKLANNRNIWINLRDLLPHPYKLSDAEDFLEHIKNEDPPLTFAIDYKNNLVGMAGLILQEDVYRKTAIIGYWLGEEYWGQGIATGAVGLLVKYGFESLDLNRIHTGVFEYNQASMRVLEKNGFEKDGIFRKSVVKDGKILDEHIFGIHR